MSKIEEHLRDLNRLAVFDGAIGTELKKSNRGSDYDFLELLNLEAPEIVKELHRRYLEAGADFLTTNTFSANSFRLGDDGLIRDINRAGARIASEARSEADDHSLIAGSVGPTGESMVPIGPLTFQGAYNSFSDQIGDLKEGGVDLLIIETMQSIGEAKAALLAAKDHKLPAMISMSYSKRGTTNYGTPPGVAAVTFSKMGAEVLGANCSTGPSLYSDLVDGYRQYSQLPISVEPNAGQPELKDGEAYYDMSASKFLEVIRPALPKVAIAGSCCGSDPSFTEALRSFAPDYPGYGPKTSSTEQETEYITSKRNVYEPSGTFYQVSIALEAFSSLKSKLNEGGQGVPLLEITASSEDYGGIEEAFARAFTRLNPETPLGLVGNDLDLLKGYLRTYPGRPTVALPNDDGCFREISARYGAYIIH